MAIVVVGGQSRNVGKTSVMCALIAALPERNWTAVKITQCKHDRASKEPCDCELGGKTVAISEERDAAARTDSSRYLAAGAVRSLWVRTRRGELGEAWPRIRAELELAENVMFESNSVLGFLEPDIYVSVLDPRVTDFKTSALQFLDRADAVVLVAEPSEPNALESMERIAKFQVVPPDYGSAELAAFVAQRISSRRR